MSDVPQDREGRAVSQDPNDKSTLFGPVEKIQLLAAAAGSFLTRSQLAAYVVLVDMCNSRTGLAYPSFATLAKRTATNVRNTKSAVQLLINRKIVLLHKQGTRTTSNRYLINRDFSFDDQLDQRSVVPDITADGVVSPDVKGSVADRHYVVSPTTHQSIHSSEHEARNERNRSVGSAPHRPGGSTDAHHPGKDRYPLFWELLTIRTTVATSEQLIADYIDDGVSYEDICMGAGRYAKYCSATNSIRRFSAESWLANERWRDDWTVPHTKSGNARTTAVASVQARTKTRKIASKVTKPNLTATGKPKRTVSIEYSEWRALERSLNKPFRENDKAWFAIQKNHLLGGNIYKCKTCSKLLSQGTRYPEIEQYCDTLKHHHTQYKSNEKKYDVIYNDWITRNPKPPSVRKK
jgi:hypothetical protein